jgi:hypothetical protein
MEITSFKVKICILPVLTFGHSKIQYLELQKSNWCKLTFVRFLTQRHTNALNFSQKQCHMREIWVFKDDNWILPANRFCEETNPNYIPKHPNRHPSFNFSNLAPLVNQSRRSRKATTNLKSPTTNQPPATSRLHTTTISWCSHLNFDFSYLQFVYK